MRQLIRSRQEQGVGEWDIYCELVLLGYDPDETIELISDTGLQAREVLQQFNTDIDFQSERQPAEDYLRAKQHTRDWLHTLFIVMIGFGIISWICREIIVAGLTPDPNIYSKLENRDWKP